VCASSLAVSDRTGSSQVQEVTAVNALCVDFYGFFKFTFGLRKNQGIS